MVRRTDLWKNVNKCVVCGTRLKFEKSSQKDAQPSEGMKFCETNHARFSVYGSFDASGGWHLRFLMPIKQQELRVG